MNSLVQKLVALIKPEQKSDDVFVGQTVATGQSSVFGGLVAGQAAMAASLTVPEERLLHSLHAYFLRPGDFSPITYEVDRIRDGRGFTTRRVNAVQHDKTIFTLSASFQVPEEGVEHQFDMPDVPSPDDLESDERFRIKVAEKLPEDRRKAFLTPRPIEFKTIEPADPMSKAPQPPQRKFWFRLIDPPHY